MYTARKPLVALLAAGLFVGSCVGGDDPTGISVAEVGIALQPALIPSPADGNALPVDRIRTVVTRQPDGVVLREQRFDVSPTAASWTLEIGVPVTGQSVDVIVYLYLLNVDLEGVETLQFSGRTDPMTVNANARLTNVDADIVRGPLSNLSVTGVTITTSPSAMFVGDEASLAATVQSSASTEPEIFWTSLDPSVLAMDDSVAIALAAGTADVVASAGAFADTVSIDVVAVTVDSVRVSPDSADVEVGQSRAYTAAVYDAGGNQITAPVTWTTANGSIATVNASGQVTGVSVGTTTVRATSGTVFDEAVVRVTAASTGGALNVWQAGPGTWTTASKWSLGRVPGAADTVHIVQGSEYVVTLDASATIAALVVGGSGVTLRVTSATLTLTGSGTGPEVDIRSLGQLELSDGTVIADGMANAGTIRGGGSLSNVQVDSIASQGVWQVDTGIQLLSNDGVSFESSGSIVFGSGAAIVMGPNGSFTYLGGAITGTGALLLNGETSLTLEDDLSLDGPTLQVQGGSILENDSETITLGPASSLQLVGSVPMRIETDLSIAGAVITLATDIDLEGTIDIVSGGTLFVENDGAASSFSTTGSVTNAGILAFAGTARNEFGPGGGGQITNTSTGVVQTIAGGTAVLNGELINAGQILVAGSTELRREVDGVPVVALHVNAASGTIELLPGGLLDIYLGGAGASPSSFTNSGRITVNTGTTLYLENLSNPAAQIVADSTAVFEGTGTVDLRGGPPSQPPLGGFNNGTIAPGRSGPGVMTWSGTVPMAPSGRIEIDIDGPSVGTGFDQLNISAQLILNGNGTLDLSGSSYSAFMGDRFPIISYGQRFGDFDSVIFPNISGVTFDTLTVVTPDTPVQVADTLVVYVSDGPSAVVGDWAYDEGQGQIAFDGVGLVNGTLGPTVNPEAGDPTWGPGRVGSALSFDGSQKVRVADAAWLEPNVFTVEAFVRAPASPGVYRYVISKGGGPSPSTSASYGLYTGAAGGLVFYTSINGSPNVTASSYIASASIWDGNWHHVAATFDGAFLSIWVDGVQVGPANAAAIGYATPQGELTIGALDPTDTTYGFIGDIDEVRITSRVLTGSEIAARAAR
jgi:hypothetical protein